MKSVQAIIYWLLTLTVILHFSSISIADVVLVLFRVNIEHIEPDIILLIYELIPTVICYRKPILIKIVRIPKETKNVDYRDKENVISDRHSTLLSLKFYEFLVFCDVTVLIV